MKHRILIIDIDGTLIDFFPRHLKIFSDYLSRFNLPALSLAKYRQQRRLGHSDGKLLTSIDPNLKVDEFYQFKTKVLEDSKYLTYDRLIPGTLDTLSILEKEATILFLTARKKLDALKQELKRFKIDYHQDVFLSSKQPLTTEVNRVKKWIEQFGNLRKAIYIGDGIDDVKLSQALDLPFIGVLSGITNRERLASFSPDKIISRLSQLDEIHLD